MSPTRRDFLKGAAGVLVAGVVIPAVAEAAPIPVPENPQIPEDYLKRLDAMDHERFRDLYECRDFCTLSDIRAAALSVDGVHTANIWEDHAHFPNEVFVDVNLNPHLVVAAIEKVIPAHVVVHVCGPVKLPGRLRDPADTMRITI